MAFGSFYNGMRLLPALASVFNLATFILSLKLLLVAVGGGMMMEDAAIITYNTSYIGNPPSGYPSGLASNISSLIPAGVSNPASVTQYLGISDWYSLHYVSTCQGSFAVDSTTNLVTSSKTNISCTAQPIGYTFSLAETLSLQLKPAVQDLVNYIPTVSAQNTMPWVALLIAGIICAGVNIVVLIFTLHGYWYLNAATFSICLLAMIFFACSSGLATGHALGVAKFGEGWASSPFLAMTWVTVALEAVALCLIQLEWRFECFHPRGRCVTCYNKPREVDSWLTMKKNAGAPENAEYETPANVER